MNTSEYNHYYYETVTKIKRALKKTKTTITKVCPICNKEFTTTNNKRKYCSEECREVAKRNISKEYMKSYKLTDAYKEALKKYKKSDKYKALRKRYYLKKKILKNFKKVKENNLA